MNKVKTKIDFLDQTGCKIFTSTDNFKRTPTHSYVILFFYIS